MSGYHWNTISPQMRSILMEFAKNELSKEFYLAGGTALALQLGHRLSVDLDFFSATQADIPALMEPLRHTLQEFSPILSDSSWGNLVFLANGVRVGFYGYGYEMVNPLLQAEGMALASVEDIALMKMDALLARASRKDFHDLYAICQRIDLRGLLELAPRKYPSVRDFEAQVARHMVAFERAEVESPLPLIEQVEWDTVKEWFRGQAKSIGKSWLG
ncbi:MAG TPA: nucleotidyl transferase AbiEii/AbiGii toxin family protein [Anaerolineales bacterium]|nr:nucleotidyl transferase AbiEii/AbiGii toxin family protein [Anaerolineales bacterium]